MKKREKSKKKKNKKTKNTFVRVWISMTSWVRDPESSKLITSVPKPNLEFEPESKLEPELQEMAQWRSFSNIFLSS